jgi:hypothetical protein
MRHVVIRQGTWIQPKPQNILTYLKKSHGHSKTFQDILRLHSKTFQDILRHLDARGIKMIEYQ